MKTLAMLHFRQKREHARFAAIEENHKLTFSSCCGRHNI